MKNNSFQHNFGTVNGEKFTDTILKVEMSIENKENKIFEFRQFLGNVGPIPYLGKFGQRHINVHNLRMVWCFILIFSSKQEHIMGNTIMDIKA